MIALIYRAGQPKSCCLDLAILHATQKHLIYFYLSIYEITVIGMSYCRDNYVLCKCKTREACYAQLKSCKPSRRGAEKSSNGNISVKQRQGDGSFLYSFVGDAGVKCH